MSYVSHFVRNHRTWVCVWIGVEPLDVCEFRVNVKQRFDSSQWKRDRRQLPMWLCLSVCDWTTAWTCVRTKHQNNNNIDKKNIVATQEKRRQTSTEPRSKFNKKQNENKIRQCASLCSQMAARLNSLNFTDIYYVVFYYFVLFHVDWIRTPFQRGRRQRCIVVIIIIFIRTSKWQLLLFRSPCSVFRRHQKLQNHSLDFPIFSIFFTTRSIAVRNVNCIQPTVWAVAFARPRIHDWCESRH